MVVPQRALVLDDNEVVVQLILDVAWRLDIACNGTTDPELFFEMVAPEVTLIFIDISMPQLDGIQVLRRLGEMRCKAGIVLISGMEHRTVEIAQELAVGFGLLVKDPLPKPFRIAELEKRLKTIVHREATTSASPPV
jgi:DNA-binding response OmpR family regulator